MKKLLAKVKTKKGFTLIEMLIVVAIIAVLAAILIPTVSSSLTKSKEAADVANIRSAVAEAEVAMLTDSTTNTLSKVYGDYISTLKLNYPTAFKVGDTAGTSAALPAFPTDSKTITITYTATKLTDGSANGSYSWTLTDLSEQVK